MRSISKEKIADMLHFVELVENYKDIPWKRIIGLRNILSHEYAAIDPEAIFNTVKIGIPPLLATINSIITDIENGKHDSLF